MRTFGSTLNFDKIIWALCNSTKGSDPKIIRSALTNATFGIFLCFLWCFLIICFNNKARSIRLKKFIKKCCSLFFNSIFLPIKRVSEALQKQKYLKQACTVICLSLLAAISLLSLFNVLRLVDKNHEITAYFNSQKSADKFDYIKDYYTIPNIKNVHFKEKNNVVLVMGESLESNFNFTEPMSKELDKIEQKGESVTKFVNATGSSWTIGALTGWHFGLPLKIPVKYDNSFVPIGNLHKTYDSKRGFLPNAKTIFEILKANGYKTALILGSDSNFSGMKKLFSMHGHFEILDKNYWQQKGWNIDKYQGTGWGFSDSFIFARAKEKYLELQNDGIPFVLIVETIDTHGPDGYCPKDKIKFYDIRDAFLETDRQISNFVNFIQKNKNAPLALGVIGDHYFMGTPPMFANIERHIRNIFIGNVPKILEEKRKQYISSVDMAPTILQASGAYWGSSKFGLGTSIFSKDKSLIQRLGQKKYNRYMSAPSKMYQSFY